MMEKEMALMPRWKSGTGNGKLRLCLIVVLVSRHQLVSRCQPVSRRQLVSHCQPVSRHQPDTQKSYRGWESLTSGIACIMLPIGHGCAAFSRLISDVEGLAHCGEGQPSLAAGWYHVSHIMHTLPPIIGFGHGIYHCSKDSARQWSRDSVMLGRVDERQFVTRSKNILTDIEEIPNKSLSRTPDKPVFEGESEESDVIIFFSITHLCSVPASPELWT